MGTLKAGVGRERENIEKESKVGGVRRIVSLNLPEKRSDEFLLLISKRNVDTLPEKSCHRPSSKKETPLLYTGGGRVFGVSLRSLSC